MGSLCVPNVGLGDIEVKFNQHDSRERDKAIRMLKDMQTRGYAILVRLDDGSYVRATGIDHERGCYIVQIPDEEPAAVPDFDAQVAGTAPVTDTPAEVIADNIGTALRDQPLPKKRRGRVRKEIPFHQAAATGIARSAGG